MLNIMVNKRFDPGKYVVLGEDPGSNGPKGIPRRDGQNYKEVVIGKYRPNYISIDAELVKPGFLFLSDSYYPGWKAYVDGRETKIYRANFMFRAVALDRGAHKIEFVYDPLSFKLGMVISIFTIFGLALAWRSLKSG